MDILSGPARVMLVSDLDHTMVDHHDTENLSLLRFNALWEAHYRHNSLLVFSTGRSPTLYKKLRKEKPMISPDITITSVGTEITYGQAMLPDDGWEHVLNQKWDRKIVTQEASALSYLKFQVSNAQEELLLWYGENAKNNPKIIHASERCASGIIQALAHFKLGPAISPRDISDYSQCKTESVTPGHEVVKFYCLYERWCRANTENQEMHLQEIKSTLSPNGVIIQPWGAEQSFCKALVALGKCYGHKQEKQFRVWIDRVSTAQVHSDTWLVKFHKWEVNGEEQRGCTASAVLQSKGGASDSFIWLHLHQTWLDGTVNTDGSGWIF